MIIPTVIDKINNHERVYDIYSRLLKDRIIIINGEINNELANSVVAQLLFLDSLNNENIRNDYRIKMYFYKIMAWQIDPIAEVLKKYKYLYFLNS